MQKLILTFGTIMMGLFMLWYFFSKEKSDFPEGELFSTVTLSVSSHRTDNNFVSLMYKVGDNTNFTLTPESTLQTAKGHKYKQNDVYLIQFASNGIAIVLHQVLPPFPKIPDDGWENTNEFYADYEEAQK